MTVADTNATMLTSHLYGAGTETTSTVLKFCLLFMCKNPDIQDKVQKEIDNHIGEQALPVPCYPWGIL